MRERPEEKDVGPVYRREGTDPAGLRTEWLLTNGLGGFAMGTVWGVPARRYHALLVAAMSPPVGRMVTLSGFAEEVTVDPGGTGGVGGVGGVGERTAHLTSFRFLGGGPPTAPWLLGFEKAGRVCRWKYALPHGTRAEKRVELVRGRNAVRVGYRVTAGASAVALRLRPLVAMRDFHGLVRASEAHEWYRVHQEASGVEVRAHGFVLRLAGAGYRPEAQWWYNFEYEMDRLRGQECVEDLFSPGVFELGVGPGAEGGWTIEAWAGPEDASEPEAGGAFRGGAAGVSVGGGDERCGDPRVRALAAAADDFVVVRRGPEGEAGAEGVSIIAGYPWFSDWGRDSMISLPGLLLCTGRFELARRLLETFASHVRGGLVPNQFDNATGHAEYNTVDASMWYLHAACEYLRVSGDRAGFDGAIRRACLAIIDGYTRGTEYGIGVDPEDGLVFAGDESTQLTWMDARRDGVVFTPRHGKAVEINALWHHGLLSVAGAVEHDDPGRAAALRRMAARTGESLRTKFWWAKQKCLRDVLTPRGDGVWEPSEQIRPNQIFAVSLAHSALTSEQQRGVVEMVRRRLLTPHGLRTLDPADPGYKGRYRGVLFERDEAYHNGTAWPWLIGPFAEAVLRVGGFSYEAKKEARRCLEPLLAALDGSCPGQLAEIYDGDDTPTAPQQPGGCPAQAWSVAEVLRVLVMCGEGSDGVTR